MRTQTIVFDVTLEAYTCDNCAGVFGINASFLKRKRAEGGSWHCPYCDTCWSATTTELMRLQSNLSATQNRLAAERARHDQTRASLTAQKGVTTRLKNRIKNGVCPCCHRHFKNVQRHIATQHPELLKCES